MKRGKPLKRGSKRLARGKGLRPVSEKRKAQPLAMNVPKEQRTCEVCEFAKGVTGWDEYLTAFTIGERYTVDRHHVFHERTTCDTEWNVLLVCRPFNQWERDCWPKAAFAIGAWALHKTGRFNKEVYPEVARKLDRPPFGKLAVWLEKGELDESPLVKTYAAHLVHEYGTEMP
jgi:hypothetical protein